MKTIQALGWYYPETLGGTEVFVTGLCRRLWAAGHEAIVAAPDMNATEERHYEYQGIPVYRYPIPRGLTRSHYRGLAPVPGTERFHGWLAQQAPDVVHVHGFVTGLGLTELKAARAIGARVYVTILDSSLGYVCQRGTMMQWGEKLCDGVSTPSKCATCELQHRGMSKVVATAVGSIPPGLGQFAEALPGKLGTALGMSAYIARRQAMQREALATVDKFILLTRWGIDAAIANGAPPERVVLNRLGFSQDLRRKPGPAEEPTTLPVRVGYLGRFDPVKGVHDLARAVRSLSANLPLSVEFRGPIRTDKDKQVVDELVRESGGDPRIKFAPAVSPDESGAVLASYDVLCCPSVCLEGGPTVAIEAHAVGTPVIGTRIGGLAEMVTDGLNGRLVPPGDWRALASVLTEIARNPAGTVDRWRLSLPPARSLDEITADYLQLYRSAGRNGNGNQGCA